MWKEEIIVDFPFSPPLSHPKRSRNSTPPLSCNLFPLRTKVSSLQTMANVWMRLKTVLNSPNSSHVMEPTRSFSFISVRKLVDFVSRKVLSFYFKHIYIYIATRNELTPLPPPIPVNRHSCGLRVPPWLASASSPPPSPGNHRAKRKITTPSTPSL